MKKTRAKKFFPLIKTLSSISKKNLSVILEFLDSESVDFISECVHNAITNNINLNDSQKYGLFKKIKSHEKKLKFISNPKNNFLKKRKYIKQSEGSIIAILSAIIPPIIGLITSQFTK